MGEDVDSTVRTISRQIMLVDPKLLVKEASKDPVLTQVMHCVKEGWPNQCSDELQDYKKLDDSLSTEHGCLFYGSMVVILASLQNQLLDLLHLEHFGMQRMKQLARCAVCWPRIDQDIERISRQCIASAEFQNWLACHSPMDATRETLEQVTHRPWN